MKQSEAFEMMKMGWNIFLTGPAGCGKTFLMNQYIEYLKHHDIEVGVTASTGLAAAHMNGRTIHSWCGMGIEREMSGERIEALKDNEQLYRRIRHAKVLIIDEISMLNARQLDLVNAICQAFRQDMRPFGGMQVIFCGDFFQLPPVTRRAGDDGRFVTESVIWNSMHLNICYLEEQYRQEDQQLLQVLNDIRSGTVTEETAIILSERLHRPIAATAKPTKLYTHNNGVDEENMRELNKLAGEEKVFEMHSEGVPHLVENLKDGCLAPERLRLKKDAVVIFVKNNFSKGYVNGTLGKVVDFEDETGYPEVLTMNGEKVVASPEDWTIEDGREIIASLSQVPLRLAWAITVHKSQGMTLDCAEMDLSRTFEYGMGYVALSRVRTLAGMTLSGINNLALQVNREVIVFDEVLRKQSQDDLAVFHAMETGERVRQQKEFLKQNKEGIVSGGIFGKL